MMEFILGVIVGGILGFLIFAVCSIARINRGPETISKKKTGENDASDQ